LPQRSAQLLTLSILFFSAQVIDVAGGKGETALRLSLNFKIPVTLVDPRVADFLDTLKKVVVPRLPAKYQARIMSAERGGVEGCLERLKEGGLRQVNCCFEDHVDERIVEEMNSGDVGLLCGLHSDNATEAIVKYGLANKISFAVVPCCVFPNFFTERRIIDDEGVEKQVRTVEDFVTYLCSLAEGIQVTRMQFNGRNIVVWKKF